MTPLNLFTLYQAFSSEVNVQQGGQIRPVQDFIYWLNAVSMDMFRDYTASAELTQLNADTLAPFLQVVNIQVQQFAGNRFGFIPNPADYQAFSDMRILRPKGTDTCVMDKNAPLITDKGKCLQVVDPDYALMAKQFAGTNLVETPVNLVDSQRWGSCLEHFTKGPTFDKPKSTQVNSGFYIAPAGLSIVVLAYYKRPTQYVFGYTIDPTTDTIIYDPATSTQSEWSDGLTNEFLTRLRKKYGVHVGDEKQYQFAEKDKTEITK